MAKFFTLAHKTPWKLDLWHQYSEEGSKIPPPLTDYLAQEGPGPFFNLILQEDGSRIILT